jgi:hypothetical protein
MKKFFSLSRVQTATGQTFPVKTKMPKRHSKQTQKYSSHKNTSSHNGKMTLYEDPVDRETTTATTSLTYSENLHPFDFYTSPPLILRSYTSLQSSNHSSTKQSNQPSQQKDNPNYTTDLTNKNTKLSVDYIHRLIEQNERRCEQQEHNTTIAHEWQILSRVVDRLLVFVFLVGTMLVFLFIFRQAPLLRLK